MLFPHPEIQGRSWICSGIGGMVCKMKGCWGTTHKPSPTLEGNTQRTALNPTLKEMRNTGGLRVEQGSSWSEPKAGVQRATGKPLGDIAGTRPWNHYSSQDTHISDMLAHNTRTVLLQWHHPGLPLPVISRVTKSPTRWLSLYSS